MLTSFVVQSIILVAIVSGIPLLASALSGLIVAVFQAATQIQDQTIGYVIKLIVVVATLVICGGWFSSKIMSFSEELLRSLNVVGQV